jgi:glycosyltransferase A (GT-A) superfamily protein (DUF2064 family)
LFYSAEYQFVPQLVAQIPWGHNRLILPTVEQLEQHLTMNDTLTTGKDDNTSS